MRDIDLEAERLFENAKALGGQARLGQDKFYWATELDANKHAKRVFDAITGAKVLEVGCASGRDALDYCSFAGSYTGIDISDEAIKKCEDLGISNAEFICTDGHIIPMGDKTFDCVIVNSLLHHLDLDVSFREISRILKDDGKLLFKEPLGTNPFFQLYRHYTPSARTDDERPFTFSDLKIMQSYFHFHDVHWFGFLNIFSAYCRVSIFRQVLTGVDYALSKTPLKYFYWQFAGEARKEVRQEEHSN